MRELTKKKPFAGDTRTFDKNKPWDGKNILPLLENAESTDINNRYFVAHRSRWKKGVPEDHKYAEASIQNNRFKLYFTAKGEKNLYDLDADLSEKKDVKNERPKIYQELLAQYNAFWKDSKNYMINDTIKAPKTHKPFHELYKEAYGEEQFNKAYKGQLEYDTFKKEQNRLSKLKVKK